MNEFPGALSEPYFKRPYDSTIWCIQYIFISLLDVACNDGSSEVRETALVSLRLLCRNPSCREVRATMVEQLTMGKKILSAQEHGHNQHLKPGIWLYWAVGICTFAPTPSKNTKRSFHPKLQPSRKIFCPITKSKYFKSKYELNHCVT